jgi:hypothetical protein
MTAHEIIIKREALREQQRAAKARIEATRRNDMPARATAHETFCRLERFINTLNRKAQTV